MNLQSTLKEESPMADTPTYGRYAEIPYDRMTPEQQEGYRSLIATRGQVGGPSKIWVHNPKLAKAAGPPGGYFRTRQSLAEGAGERAAVILNTQKQLIYPPQTPE